jgi:hypothetical protein
LFCKIVLFNPDRKKQIKDTVQRVSNVSNKIRQFLFSHNSNLKKYLLQK